MTTESVGQLDVDAARGRLPADWEPPRRRRGLRVAGNPDGAAFRGAGGQAIVQEGRL